MLNKDLQDAINVQIRNEYYSSYLYLSMAAYCESKNFPGFASWLRRQSNEELTHAMRLFDYMIDRDGRVILEGIDQPPSEFGTLIEMFEEVLEHEKEVTGMINRLYELAVSHNDHATSVELQWFIQEQVEEEKSASDLVEQLKLAGENSAALLMLDRELISVQSATND
ncbi:MAG: ferritin [Candidatus Dadabacteria bacterium]|nr:ferritin [Candidatus Dadabacteria bacterium]NIQ16312.1 ferritin [Candidatus Dadabacteria bacterium]